MIQGQPLHSAQNHYAYKTLKCSLDSDTFWIILASLNYKQLLNALLCLRFLYVNLPLPRFWHWPFPSESRPTPPISLLFYLGFWEEGPRQSGLLPELPEPVMLRSLAPRPVQTQVALVSAEPAEPEESQSY